jgi:hypothetical protein
MAHGPRSDGCVFCIRLIIIEGFGRTTGDANVSDCNVFAWNAVTKQFTFSQNKKVGLPWPIHFAVIVVI